MIKKRDKVLLNIRRKYGYSIRPQKGSSYRSFSQLKSQTDLNKTFRSLEEHATKEQ